MKRLEIVKIITDHNISRSRKNLNVIVFKESKDYKEPLYTKNIMKTSTIVSSINMNTQVSQVLL